VNDAVQVGANGRVLVDAAAVIPEDGDLATTATDYGSFARLDGADITNITRREVIPVLLGDIQILLEVFRCRAKRDTGRIVEFCPLVLSALD
jgi:hypothetical protein